MDHIPAVASVMTPFPYSVDVGDSVRRAHGLMVEHEVRHLPVLDGHTLVGVLTDRDVKRALDPEVGLPPRDELFVRDVYVSEPYAVDGSGRGSMPFSSTWSRITSAARSSRSTVVWQASSPRPTRVRSTASICGHCFRRVRGKRWRDRQRTVYARAHRCHTRRVESERLCSLRLSQRHRLRPARGTQTEQVMRQKLEHSGRLLAALVTSDWARDSAGPWSLVLGSLSRSAVCPSLARSRDQGQRTTNGPSAKAYGRSTAARQNRNRNSRRLCRWMWRNDERGRSCM